MRRTLSDLSRRDFLIAAGATAGATSLGGAGSAAATEAPNTGDSPGLESMYLTMLALAGKRIVGEDGYTTIAEAWADADDGDVVYVHSSYDAKSAGEQFPITLDFSEKEVSLMGGHPSGSVIDARHTTQNVLEIIGAGHHDYRNLPMVQNLKIIGGNIGLRVRAAPYATFKDLVFWQCGSHGVSVEEYTDSNGTFKGTFGVTFRNVQAWTCEGDGFRLETKARPHSTTFFGCDALFNRGYGVMLRGYSTRWFGGTIQNNHLHGVDARSGPSQLIDGVYFEGNGAAMDYPVAVYATAPGFTVENSYFNGHYARDFPNGRADGYYGVALVGAHTASVSNCTYRNYDESFLYVDDASDVDIHASTHQALDETALLTDSASVERLRSGEMIMPTDLRGVEGRFRGDVAIHNGSGSGLFGLAIWTGYGWMSQTDGSYVWKQ